jgi:hypothetical protein
MPVRKMKFVLVNNMAPRNPSVRAECSRLLERSYLHDLSTSRRYCGIECYPQWMLGEWIRRIGRSNEPSRTRYRLAEAHR